MPPKKQGWCGSNLRTDEGGGGVGGGEGEGGGGEGGGGEGEGGGGEGGGGAYEQVIMKRKSAATTWKSSPDPIGYVPFVIGQG